MTAIHFTQHDSARATGHPGIVWTLSLETNRRAYGIRWYKRGFRLMFGRRHLCIYPSSK